MKITALMENTTILPEIHAEHGLSLYIETEKHKILFDTGASRAFADNAERLGIDLSNVDVAILSHGHYDHGGGLARFMEVNQKAPIYIGANAFEPYYNAVEAEIGLDKSLKDSSRFVPVEEKFKIDDELELFTCNKLERKYGTNPFGLHKCENGKLVPDDFLHEQYLLIHEGEKQVLISGCSHKGILNIMDWFHPDVLVGGFHFMKMDPEGEGKKELLHSAEILKTYPAVYYTCHCTGLEQFDFLKQEMKEQLQYLSSGMVLEISTNCGD